MANQLVHSSSPYLLQHAQNPVNWYPWGKEALEKAKAENKLLLVSIGYSACHWCHVMEHESFENEAVADVMNAHFICVKIDREERPDIDQIYMEAVQLMTGRGGWPLNCICLPDQRPIYGGTYFPKADWLNVLQNLADLWQNKPKDALDYAERLTFGIKQSEQLVKVESPINFKKEDLDAVFEQWKKSWDYRDGAHNRAPKFPMPNNWLSTMRYAHQQNNDAAMVITRLTLDKMAAGGIYDQLGGGFARYSVDGHWRVPHFEKMLYDNAQLVSLYSQAFCWCREEKYRDVVAQTLNWISHEMTSAEGGFYSALDADSEGVEGKFYVWGIEELTSVLGDETALFCHFFDCTDEGNWEEEQTNILKQSKEAEVIAAKFKLSVNDLKAKIETAKVKLLKQREQRVRPGLDDKILASWNGLILKAYADAYRVFDDENYLKTALKSAVFLMEKMMNADGKLYRTYKNGTATINGFLEDYAFVIDAFIALYEVTFDVKWIFEAKRLSDMAIADFYNEETGFFYYTSSADEALIARKTDLMDNVIPSSNSQMAINLRKLGLFFDDEGHRRKAEIMLQNIYPQIKTYPSAYSNWLILLMDELFGTNEVIIRGTNAAQLRKEFEQNYVPDKIIMGGTAGILPLLRDKPADINKIYVCFNKSCKLPVNTVDEALKQLI